MNNIIRLSKAILIMMLLSAQYSYATELHFPTLEETFRQNEQRIYENYQQEQEKRQTISQHATHTGDISLPHQYANNEPIGFVKELTYTPVSTGNAVSLFRANEEYLWMQEIHLNRGAKLASILVNEGFDPEEAGGEPLFAKMTLTEMRNTLPQTPFSLINGQFFDPRSTPTRLSFGLKMDGEIRTVGADNGNKRKNILLIREHIAEIQPYTSWENLRDANADFAMVNLSLLQPHYRNSNIGRTYICLKNPNHENQSSTLLIFTAQSMNERNMENELLRQGCTYNSSTKLDSSGSTRLWHGGVEHYGASHKGEADKRRIPHGIAVIDAP